jgi:localization factor PodJL
MSQRAKRLGEQLAAANPVADKIPVLPALPAAEPPASDTPASEPDGDQTAEIPPASHRIDQSAAPADANRPANIATAEAPRTVTPRTVAGPDRIVQLAMAGNPVALAILGLKALDGTASAPANLPDAVKFLTQAADKGQAVAQYRLGTLYERGQGVAADPAKAMHWYELAADQGNRKAMHNLAVAYASGPAAKRNMTLAARWFAKAATLGLADSQFNLAVLYERGEGVPQSLSDAYKWYAIAALSGDGEAKARMAVLDTQLKESDRTAANRSAASFRVSPLSRSVNVPPEPADLGT